MLRLFKNKKAQSTAEYAMIFGLVIGAVVAAQTLVRRGLDAKIADGTNAFVNKLNGAQITFAGDPAGVTLNSTKQWEAGYSASDYQSESVSNTAETMGGGAIVKDQLEVTGRSGNQTTTANPTTVVIGQ